MVGNTKIEQQLPIDDHNRPSSSDIEQFEVEQFEVEQLRSELRELKGQLAAERSHRGVLQRALANATARIRALDGQRGSVDAYAFDDDDDSGAAFDDFFATPDPDLEKLRGFLLD